jgi:putative endonuclease
MGPLRTIAVRLRQWLSSAFPSRTERAARGVLGEREAARALRRAGYKILVRNYSSRWGEIDLVCRHENTLVFVEVKTRAADALERPARAVHRSKRRRLIRTAQAYVQELGDPSIPQRFDIVEVLLHDEGRAECHILPHAFTVDT